MVGLFCWVVGTKPHHYFAVKIPRNQNVDSLRALIKETTKPQLDHHPVNTLTLWKVSIPLKDANAKLPAFQLDEELSNGAIQLFPGDRLKDVFSRQPPATHIHIIVQSGANPQFTCVFC
jgi:hypothetical protein